MKDTNGWQVESIPATHGRKYLLRAPLLDKLIELSARGEALRILQAEYGPSASVRQSLHNLAARRGYAYHAQATARADGSYLIWVTQAEPTNT